MTRRAVLLFACFVLAATLIARASKSEPVAIRASFDEFPLQLAGWRGVILPPFDPEVLNLLKVDDYMNRLYVAPDRSSVNLYVGYYSTQRRGDTMHSPLNCMPGAGWTAVSDSFLPVTVRNGSGAEQSVVVNRYVIEKGLDRQLVLYWYQSHGRVVASEYWSKFFLVKDAISLNRTDGSLVRIVSPIKDLNAGEEDRALATATRFLGDLFPVLASHLPG